VKKAIFFLFFIQQAYSQTSINQFLTEAFEAMKTKNVHGYKKLLVSEAYALQLFLDRKEKEGAIFTDRQKASLDSFMHEEFLKYEPGFIDQYNKVIKNNPKTNIDWAQTVLDSTRSDSVTENQITTYDSKIYFSNTAGTRFFIMNVKNSEKYKGRIYLNDIYVPYLNYGATNRFVTKSLKPIYIKNCIAEVAKMPASMLHGKTPAYYCECQYNTVTEEADGVDKVKKGFIGIYYNNGSKKQSLSPPPPPPPTK
jgi:hypothetical protein